jgi:hypothetical protein
MHFLIKEQKNKSQEGSISPPPEEINIRMPEMSALIVQEPSMLNDSAQFCLDEIFQSSSKKVKRNDTQADDATRNLVFSDVKGKGETMKDILSNMDSKKMPSSG